MKTMKIFALLLMAGLLSGLGGFEASFAPKSELWERWAASDEESVQSVDHSAWDRFLDAYLHSDGDGYNLVAYGEVSEGDKQALEAYVAGLAETDVGELRRAEQLPFWINLYNALTVSVVLDHYPVETIRDINISPGFFSVGPWGKKLIEIEGEKLSLNDIEHRILRPVWQDARLHYVLNCAARGCPNLLPKAFTADNADAMMTEAAREFVNHPRGARRDGDGMVVSSIYDWYIADFGGDEAGVVAHMRKYAGPALLDVLAQPGTLEADYDWVLNEFKR